MTEKPPSIAVSASTGSGSCNEVENQSTPYYQHSELWVVSAAKSWRVETGLVAKSEESGDEDVSAHVGWWGDTGYCLTCGEGKCMFLLVIVQAANSRYWKDAALKGRCTGVAEA